MSRAGQTRLKGLTLASALDAAEKRMEELKLAKDENKRVVLAQECRDLLDKAEQLKAASMWQSSGQDLGKATSVNVCKVGVGLRSKNPRSRRALTTREKIILLEGSRLHGFVFPPWISSPSPSEFELKAGESLYQYVDKEDPPLRAFPYRPNSHRDDPELPLSLMQRAIFDGWKRPAQAFPLPCLQQPALFSNPNPNMMGEGKIDLVQDVTADCSVVASLCAITARAERGHSKVLFPILRSHDTETISVDSFGYLST